MSEDKTTIKVSLSKNRKTGECEIDVHIDSPFDEDSYEHQRITKAVTTRLWAANFRKEDFDENRLNLIFQDEEIADKQEFIDAAIEYADQAKKKEVLPVHTEVEVREPSKAWTAKG